jgi:hypothetical protein
VRIEIDENLLQRGCAYRIRGSGCRKSSAAEGRQRHEQRGRKAEADVAQFLYRALNALSAS